MFKLLFGLVGAIIGLAVAWATRPSVWGHRPDMSDILSISEFQGDFIIYSIVGLVAGLLIGVVVDMFRPK